MFGIGGYSGLGANDQPQMTAISVRTLQKLLLRKGVSVGRTGADGIWGPMTEKAFQNACLEAPGQRPDSYCMMTDPSASKRQVRVPAEVLNAIRSLQDDPRPDPAARRQRAKTPTTAMTTDVTDVFGNGKKKPAWPWVVGIGGGLLLLGGAYWYSQQPGRGAR